MSRAVNRVPLGKVQDVLEMAAVAVPGRGDDSATVAPAPTPAAISHSSDIQFVKAADNVVLAEYSVNVTNTGAYDADDVVLGFIKPPGGGVDGVPLQSLFNFERVHVNAGQTVTVTLAAKALDFTAVQPDGRRVALVGRHTVEFGVFVGGRRRPGVVEMGFAATQTILTSF